MGSGWGAVHLGSTSEVRNADGSLHSAQGYTAFGAVWYRMGSLPTDRTYTGQTEIEYGLVNNWARAYDPYSNYKNFVIQ